MKKAFLFLLLLPGLAYSQSPRAVNLTSIGGGVFSASMTLSPTSTSGLTSVAGSQGASSSWTATWSRWTASNDTVTAPSGFVVSTNNSTFASSVSFATSGSSGSQTLYVALAAGNSAGSYSGSVTHTAGAVVAYELVSGSTSAAPSMSVSPTSLTLTDTAGSSGYPQNIALTWANITGNITQMIPTNTAPIEVSTDGGSTYSSGSHTISTGSPLTLKVRVNSAATAGPIVDTVQFAASGVSTIKVPIGGTVSSGGTAHYRTITIPTTSVGSSDLDSFPMIFTGTYSYLATVANGGYVQNSNGYDIFFSTDAAGTNILPFERISWTASTGACQFAVNIPVASASSNTVVYLHYGSTSITTDQSNQHATWNNGFAAVYHMEETITAASQTIHDATKNGMNGGSYGTWVAGDQAAGVVGGSLQVAGSADINFGPWTTPSTYTIESWYKTTVASNTTVAFGYNTGYVDINNYGGAWHFFNGSADIIATTSTQTTGTWVHSAFTVSGTTATAYYNGASQASTSTLGQTVALSIMGGYSGGFSSALTFDEVRLSSVTRSAGWIAAEYNNMHSPSTFYTIGTQN